MFNISVWIRIHPDAKAYNCAQTLKPSTVVVNGGCTASSNRPMPQVINAAAKASMMHRDIEIERERRHRFANMLAAC